MSITDEEIRNIESVEWRTVKFNPFENTNEVFKQDLQQHRNEFKLKLFWPLLVWACITTLVTLVLTFKLF